MLRQYVGKWAVALLLFGWMAGAQDAPKVVIKHVPIQHTAADSGAGMFHSYCGSCHGVSMKGDGPAVPALKVVPPDLTTLAQRNGNKFPFLKVANIIRGDEATPAHGDKDMPVWGPLFRSLGENQGVVHLRIKNLGDYIESKQVK